jgi:hypothetical protein
MQKYLSIIFLLLFIQKGFAQNINTDYKSAIKIYNLTYYENSDKSIFDSTIYSTHTKNSSLKFFHPTVAFQWKSKKNNFHEIELTNFNLTKNKSEKEIVNDSTNSTQLTKSKITYNALISLRYEYIIVFKKLKQNKFVPSLGFGIKSYFKDNYTKHEYPQFFTTSNKQLGFNTYITPRINYFFSQKIFIDVNIPICIFSLDYNSELINNPANSNKNTEYNVLNFDAFNNAFSARIGFGVKI